LSLYLVEGRWDDLLSAASTMIDSHIASIRGWASVTLADALRARGRLDDAYGALEPYLPAEVVQPEQLVFQDLWVPVMAQLQAARIELDRGNHDAARHWLTAHDRWREWWQAIYGRVDSHLIWARLLWDSDPRAAEAHVLAAVDNAHAPRQPLGLITAYRMLGELLVDSGRLDEAAEHLQESRWLAHACEAPFELAQTLVGLAELSITSGDRDAALECLADARAICDPLAADPTLRRIELLETRVS
jgi:tetratricopeptide (TPR) repeat protein